MPTGEVSVRMEFKADAPKPATGGQVTLFVNDRPWVKGGWITRCPSASPAMPRWTSGATTAASSTGRYESPKAVPVQRDHPQGGLRRRSRTSSTEEAELHAVASHTAAGHALGE